MRAFPWVQPAERSLRGSEELEACAEIIEALMQCPVLVLEDSHSLRSSASHPNSFDLQKQMHADEQSGAIA